MAQSTGRTTGWYKIVYSIIYNAVDLEAAELVEGLKRNVAEKYTISRSALQMELENIIYKKKGQDI